MKSIIRAVNILFFALFACALAYQLIDLSRDILLGYFYVYRLIRRITFMTLLVGGYVLAAAGKELFRNSFAPLVLVFSLLAPGNATAAAKRASLCPRRDVAQACAPRTARQD